MRYSTLRIPADPTAIKAFPVSAPGPHTVLELRSLVTELEDVETVSVEERVRVRPRNVAIA